MSTEEIKKYSYEEISKHNSVKKSWIVIHDNIYDVTLFLDEHPGGAEVILEQAGKNATENFEDVGHSSDARLLMEKYKIGEVIEEERQEGKDNDSCYPESGDSDGSWTSWLIPLAIAFIASIAYRYFFTSATSHRE